MHTRNICLLHRKSGFLRKKIWANKGANAPTARLNLPLGEGVSLNVYFGLPVPIWMMMMMMVMMMNYTLAVARLAVFTSDGANTLR